MLDNRTFWGFGLTEAEADAVLRIIDDSHLWDQDNEGEFLPEEKFLRQFEDRLRAWIARR